MMLAILGRLKDREQGSVLHKLGFRAAEVDQILEFEEAAHATGKELTGRSLPRRLMRIGFWKDADGHARASTGIFFELNGGFEDSRLFA